MSKDEGITRGMCNSLNRYPVTLDLRFRGLRIRRFNAAKPFASRISSLSNAARCILPAVGVFLFAVEAEAQIQVDLKFKRLQYIAYEPVMATLAITNLAGRDIDLHDAGGQSWLGFEITGNEGQPIAPMTAESDQSPLKVDAGQ